jgi:hypothetical protein
MREPTACKAIRYPTTAVCDQPNKESSFGGAQVFQTLSQGPKEIDPKK